VPLHPACSYESLLDRYLLGQNSEEERARIARHIETCPTCAAVLRSQPTSATIESKAIETAPADGLQSSDFAQTRAPSAVGAEEPSREGPADKASSLPSSEVGAQVFAFLAPPQNEEEIGRVARYRVLKQLGVGGMGVVFQAEAIDLQRPVALKVMLPEMASRGGAGARASCARPDSPRRSRAITSSRSTRLAKIVVSLSWPWSCCAVSRSRNGCGATRSRH
jgi:anti-sigma factor RsiW